MFPEARFEGPPVAVVDWAAWSRCGTLRPANGDAWGADGVTRFAIADGVGINQGGQVAATHVVERFLGAPSAMDEALTREVSQSIRQESSEHGMVEAKSTFTSLSINQAGGHLLTHVGDSRAYLVRSHRVRRLTVDHNLDLLRRLEGERPDVSSRAGGSLFSWIGQHPGPKRIDVGYIDLVPEDLIFLTTDGVHRAISLPRFIIGMQAEGSCEAAIAAITDAVDNAPSGDDATVIALRIGAETAGSGSCR